MIGKTLAHYEITELLGRGGMGEVYRARDTKLDRDVALKLLTPDVAGNPERLARLRREARTLASIHHPRVASVFGLEELGDTTFLVMELVEGQDLSGRLAAGRLDVETTVRIALQIAEGLEEAHEKGIVHRDLKPANIKLASDGQVKILDFGLARAFVDDAGDQDLENSPTITAAMTQAGVILGTAAYMSPEQAKGKRVDRRCDIWAFGVILHEMLSGTRLFAGETISETMAEVMKGEIDLDLLPGDTPDYLRKLLERCLDRDPKTRLRDIGEARVALSRPQVDIVETPRARPASRTPWLLAAAALLLAAGSWIWQAVHTDEASDEILSFQLMSGFGANLRQGDGRSVAISPDGTRIVSRGAHGNDAVLLVRSLDEFEPRVLLGTEGGRLPTFSPDGEWIAFQAARGLAKVNLSGGAPVDMGRTPAASNGLSWSDDGYVYLSFAGSILRLAESGGEVETVLSPSGEDVQNFSHPHALPGGKGLLLHSGGLAGSQSELYAWTPDMESPKKLGMIGSDARYVPGYIIFAQSSQVLAAPFDLDRLEIAGTAIPVLERVWVESTTLHLDFSSTGTAVYVPSRPGDRPDVLLVDRQGNERPIIASDLPFATWSDPRFSPDGSRLVFSVEGSQIWILDLRTETPTLLSESGFYPVWEPSGESLVFGSSRNGSYDLFRVPSDLSSPERLIRDQENNLRPTTFAPDGSFVLREEIPNKGMDLKLWTDLEDPDSIRGLLEGPDDELAPAISPDGRWMAYVSDLSGSDQIYVTSFPNPGARIQISAGGGTSPAWSPAGDEIFYMNGDAFMAASVDVAGGVRVLSREKLFSGSYLQYRWYRQYDVHPVEGSFVLIENPPRGDVEVITNWQSRLAEKFNRRR